MEKNPKFIHLRSHSEYSLLEGALRLKKLPELLEMAINIPWRVVPFKLHSMSAKVVVLQGEFVSPVDTLISSGGKLLALL